MNRTVKDAVRCKASIEQITFEDNRVDKNQIHRLADCNFIKRHENIIITGSTESEKKLFSLCNRPPGMFIGVSCIINTAKLFARMKIAKADGSYLKELSKMEKQHLLLIDDFGIQPLDAQSRSALMEIIERQAWQIIRNNNFLKCR
ncbi:MAG: ATP-binding protein [Bacteroidetes bacterium]|nr:ATP-binding protein [Bacteroidota bacterium]